MKIKVILIVAIAFISSFTYSQNEVNELIELGIKYHDEGNYEKAIENYNRALSLDPESTVILYEISLSYMQAKEYDKAIEYADMVLEKKSDHMIQAYMTKGSALDMMGKTKQSIKLFNRAIKEEGGHYLLYYNLALNHYKLNQLDEAEENLHEAILSNNNHSSSHLLLAYIYNNQNKPVETLMSLHYFLFLEPNSSRSLNAYNLLLKNFGANVTKNDKEPNTINIILNAGSESQFSSAEMMLSLLEASKNLEENESKTEDQMFVENTKSFFAVLGELPKKSKNDIWNELYIPFFSGLADSEFMETYVKYISQSSSDEAMRWIAVNPQKMEKWGTWLKSLN